MFASDAPMTDQTMVVDAVTVDGRHVDPYSEATSRYANPGRAEVPARLDNDSFIFNYSGRIAGSGAYHQALIEWILAYHERTGNPNDKIVSFDAYEVDRRQPAHRPAAAAQHPQPAVFELPAETLASPARRSKGAIGANPG